MQLTSGRPPSPAVAPAPRPASPTTAASPSALDRVANVSRGEEDSHVSVLFAASEECVASLSLLSRVAPSLSLASGFSRDVHTLLYLVGNVETALHLFVDRELLGEREGFGRRREQGGKLQDALGRATRLKSTVKASLLAGGIASLLHLFALTLRRLNGQLEHLLKMESDGDAYVWMLTLHPTGLPLPHERNLQSLHLSPMVI